MPLLDATFKDGNGQPDRMQLRNYGPSIAVTVTHYIVPGTPAITPPAGVPPSVFIPPSEMVWALVDTGACESCIDADLATRLGLPVIDTMQIAGANGANTHDVYLAQLGNIDLEFSQFGRFAGVHLASGGQAHGVLLGRTFLENCLMIYDGLRGQVTLSSPRVP